MSRNTIQEADNVLGYELVEHIGSGGYGEVWKAVAPGGLAKAVKFIYGFHDEDRAQRELKALNNIKAVRHPFLLSLERIEVVDRQLVIVTELAESSLKDHFEKCLLKGQRGIPHSELLTYMHEAATALDYINHEHSLQHLDIKPENLLIVSGHVKVADFGLVKQIHDGTVSLMGGLTPRYAPPELFESAPSRHSDQYSLAIVYQEMLTGARPFDGSSVAELAAQHMRARPRLSRLTRTDRLAVARALSKNPADRHQDCMTFVSQLAKSKAGVAIAKNASKVTSRPPRPADLDAAHSGGLSGTTRVEPLLGNSARSPRDLRSLEPVDLERTRAGFRQTLVVGIGQTGTKVLAGLRARLKLRNGSQDDLPAIHLLAIDTSQRELQQASNDMLDPHEMLAIPLRTTEEYRAGTRSHLTWLSRRWLYNIPRTRQTEGIRPLGRLAFADHVQAIRDRVTEVFEKFDDTLRLRKTARQLHLRADDEQPRVIIIGSVSGGLGSGCATDIAYLLRSCLGDVGLPEDCITGILAYSMMRGPGSERELMMANTYAFLTELCHFHQHGFPGDASCDLPVCDVGQHPFTRLYLQYLGDELGVHEFESHIEALAEYVYLRTSSATATLFDMGDQQHQVSSFQTMPAEDAAHVPTSLDVRSVGLAQFSRTLDASPQRVIDTAARCLLARWVDGDDTIQAELTVNCEKLHDKMAVSSGLATQLAEQVLDRVMHVGSDRSAWLNRKVQESTVPLLEKIDERRIDGILQEMLEMFELPGTDSAEAGRLGSCCEEYVQVESERLCLKITNTINALINTPSARVTAARTVVERLRESIDMQVAEFNRTIDQVTMQVADTRVEMFALADRKRGAKPEELVQLVSKFVTRLYERGTFQIASRLLKSVAIGIGTEADRLARISHHLNRVLNTFDPTAANCGAANYPQTIDKLLTRQFDYLLPEIVRRSDIRFNQQCNPAQPRLLEYVSGDVDLFVLSETIRRSVGVSMRDVLWEMDLGNDLQNACQADPELMAELKTSIESASPRLISLAGAKRVFMIASQEKTKESSRIFAKQHLGLEPSLGVREAGGLVCCTEVSEIPLVQIAVEIQSQRPTCLQFASRLKSRTDIKWSGLR